MDRRARRCVGKGRHQVRMREQPGPFLLVELDLLERGVGRQLGPVELCQPAVQVDLVGKQQTAEIGRVAPDRVFEEKVQRRPQVRRDHRAELREDLRVLGHVGGPIDLQPLEQELADLGSGPQVGDHALGLRGDLVPRGQLAGGRGLQHVWSGSESQRP